MIVGVVLGLDLLNGQGLGFEGGDLDQLRAIVIMIVHCISPYGWKSMKNLFTAEYAEIAE